MPGAREAHRRLNSKRAFEALIDSDPPVIAFLYQTEGEGPAHGKHSRLPFGKFYHTQENGSFRGQCLISIRSIHRLPARMSNVSAPLRTGRPSTSK
jgi:hypothetical protein